MRRLAARNLDQSRAISCAALFGTNVRARALFTEPRGPYFHSATILNSLHLARSAKLSPYCLQSERPANLAEKSPGTKHMLRLIRCDPTSQPVDPAKN
ncbi:hypothetical protein RRG08_008489 [Elysia crispata]|uniref:Uncharacterized protein n=1 Tax=Elysia crispata TaxID=231223 RepID=A0AAE1DBJ2_9GAST|nr:hypothetical protein RRG08_008489 [Elysia crispata]